MHDHGHTDCVEQLLKHGANVEARTNLKQTPLHLAAIRGTLETAALLLDAGADTSAKDMQGRTVLELARTHRIGRTVGRQMLAMLEEAHAKQRQEL
jgi:ankyrin repeat protein